VKVIGVDVEAASLTASEALRVPGERSETRDPGPKLATLLPMLAPRDLSANPHWTITDGCQVFVVLVVMMQKMSLHFD
jgi:hypothetical protein